MNNLCHTFLAKGVKKTTEPHLERSEEIHVHLKTKDEVVELLKNNSIVEAVMQAPLWRYINI